MSVVPNIRAAVRPNTAADNDVALLGGNNAARRLRCAGGIISAGGGANNLTFKNKADDSTILQINLAANEKVVLPFHDNWEMGYFTGKVGSDIEVALSAATVVDIDLVFFAVS